MNNRKALACAVLTLFVSASAYAGCSSNCEFKIFIPGIRGVSNPVISLVTDSTIRAMRYSDGTYASSCQAYLQPANSNYVAGTNSGVYAISVGSLVMPVYCNQTLNGGGWALLMKQAHGDGTTLEGDTTYWTDGDTLNDTSAYQNMDDGNFVSAAFGTLPVAQLMLQAANETTVQTHNIGAAESAMTAFGAAVTRYSDAEGVPLAAPNWFIHDTTYPNGNTIDQARFGFNFMDGVVSGADDCGARWGWAMNQDASSAPGSDDYCGGLGAYGNTYGTKYMSNNKNAGQRATLYLWGK